MEESNATEGTSPSDSLIWRLAVVPRVLALLALASLYLLRWSYLESPIRDAFDATLENAIGNDVEIRVGELSGPLFTGITVARIETIHPATSGFIRGVELENVRLEYRLVELLPLITAAVAPGIPVSGPDAQWLFAEEVDTARLIAELHEVWPRGTAARATGELLVRSPQGWARPELLVDLGSSVSGQTAEVQLRLDGLDRGEAIPDELEVTTFDVTLAVATNRLEVDLDVNGGDLASVHAVVEARDATMPTQTRTREDEASATTATITSATATARAPGLLIEVDGGREGVGLVIEIEEDEPFLNQLVSIFAPNLEAGVGSLSVDVRGESFGATNVSILDTLVEQPAGLPLVANIDGSVNGAEWRIDSLAVEDLGAQISWTDNVLRVTSVNASGALVGAVFNGDAEPSASVGLVAREIRYDPGSNELGLQGFRLVAGSAQLRASGSVDLAGYEPSSWSEATGSIDGRLRIANPPRVVSLLQGAGLLSENLPVRFEQDSLVQVAFDLRGRESGFRAALAPTVRGVSVGSVEVTSLDLRTVVEGKTATVSTLEAEIENQTVGLTSPIELSWAGGYFVLEGMRLRAGGAMLAADAEIGPGSLSAEASLTDVSVEMIASMLDASTGGAYGGTISVDVSVSGTAAQPVASVEARSSELVFDGAPGQFVVAARQEESGIVLDQLSIELGEIARARGSGTIPVVVSSEGVSITDLATADLNLVAFVALARLMPDLELEPWSNAVVRAEVDVEGEGGSASVLVTEIDTEGQLALAGIDPFRGIRIDASVDSLVGPTMSIDGLIAGDDTEIATFAAIVPLARDVSGQEPTVEAELDIPLGRLSHLVPGLSLLGGSVLGTLSVSGGAEGLQAAGDLSVEEALVKLAAGVPTISAMNGRITFTERQATIEELYGRMGQETVTVSGSVSLPESGDLQTALPNVNVSVEGEGVLLARTPDVAARGDLDLSIVSQSESVRVTGRFDATEVVYTKPVQLLSLGSEAETAGSGIELFYLDAAWARSVSLSIRMLADEAILVENNLYEGRLSADLRIRGTAAVPRPEGRVFASDGVVTLPTATLDIEQLRVQFPPDSALNPSVFARARASTQGYEMLITVDGQFPNVEVDVASSPPLPTDQALVLLATGQQPSQLSFAGEGGTLQAAGTVLGRSLISELAGSVSGDGGGFFDRLQFDIERDAESDLIGNLQVEYQFADSEPWYLLVERVQAEEYTVRLSWRLWAD